MRQFFRVVASFAFLSASAWAQTSLPAGTVDIDAVPFNPCDYGLCNEAPDFTKVPSYLFRIDNLYFGGTDSLSSSHVGCYFPHEIDAGFGTPVPGTNLVNFTLYGANSSCTFTAKGVVETVRQGNGTYPIRLTSFTAVSPTGLSTVNVSERDLSKKFAIHPPGNTPGQVAFSTVFDYRVTGSVDLYMNVKWSVQHKEKDEFIGGGSAFKVYLQAPELGSYVGVTAATVTRVRSGEPLKRHTVRPNSTGTAVVENFDHTKDMLIASSSVPGGVFLPRLYTSDGNNYAFMYLRNRVPGRCQSHNVCSNLQRQLVQSSKPELQRLEQIFLQKGFEELWVQAFLTKSPGAANWEERVFLESIGQPTTDPVKTIVLRAWRAAFLTNPTAASLETEASQLRAVGQEQWLRAFFAKYRSPLHHSILRFLYRTILGRDAIAASSAPLEAILFKTWQLTQSHRNISPILGELLASNEFAARSGATLPEYLSEVWERLTGQSCSANAGYDQFLGSWATWATTSARYKGVATSSKIVSNDPVAYELRKFIADFSAQLEQLTYVKGLFASMALAQARGAVDSETKEGWPVLSENLAFCDR